MESLNLIMLEEAASTMGYMSSKEILSLQERLAEAGARYKECIDLFKKGLALRYEDKINLDLKCSGRHTGKVDFEEDGFIVSGVASRTISWDQRRLTEACKDMSEWQKENYLKVKYTIDERKYKSAPASIKDLLEPSRMVSKTNVKISLKGDE